MNHRPILTIRLNGTTITERRTTNRTQAIIEATKTLKHHNITRTHRPEDTITTALETLWRTGTATTHHQQGHLTFSLT